MAHRRPRRPVHAIARTARCVLLAFTCAVALGVLAPLASAAPAPDPVLAAITRSLGAKEITAVQARDLRLTWATSARAARTASTTNRRANIANVRAFTTNLARSGGLTSSRLVPALLSVQATTTVMQDTSTYPKHEQELELPDEVIVFTYYSLRGVQVQPFETFKQGLRELNQLTPDVEAARAIADRMLELGVRRGDTLAWEYFFQFGGPARPWTSAISQAIGTEFFYRVGMSLPEAERAPYLDAAAAISRSFLHSPAEGGVGVVQGKGRYYLMYSFASWQRILNGHLQVLLNLKRYADASGSPDAQRVYDLGLAAVLPLLPKFDTGAWSNYQPGQEAELGYHEFQTDQLVKLGEETGNAAFADLGARFTQYLETPPVLTIIDTQWPSIIPAKDGLRDGATVRFTLDKRSKVTLVLFDSNDAEVRRLSVTRGRGAGTLTWDGRSSSGAVVPDGDYRGELTITDVAGNRAFEELPGALTVERDLLPPELGTVTLRPSGKVTIVTVVATDAGSAWIDAKLVIGTTTVTRVRGGAAGRAFVLRVPRPIAQVRTGHLVLRDSTGNELDHPLTAGD